MFDLEQHGSQRGWAEQDGGVVGEANRLTRNAEQTTAIDRAGRIFVVIDRNGVCARLRNEQTEPGLPRRCWCARYVQRAVLDQESFAIIGIKRCRDQPFAVAHPVNCQVDPRIAGWPDTGRSGLRGRHKGPLRRSNQPQHNGQGMAPVRQNHGILPASASVRRMLRDQRPGIVGLCPVRQGQPLRSHIARRHEPSPGTLAEFAPKRPEIGT